MAKWNEVFVGPRAPRRPVAPTPVNHIAFVVDESGSMDEISKRGASASRALVEGSFKEIFNTIRDKGRGQETFVSLYKVNGTVRTEFVGRQPEDVGGLNYHPGGMTPLNDGIGTAIQALDGARRDPDMSYLVVVLTDGQENASRRFVSTDIRRMIQERQAKGNWTFVFQVPPGQRALFIRNYGLEDGNIREWEASESGLRETTVQTVASTQHYFQARATGARATKSFYSDLSGLAPSTIRNTLNDLQHQYKAVAVPREAEIRTFVEEVTGRPYTVGSTFYQLTKPEVVQSNKSLLVQEKGKRSVWGGPEARNLIGLPLYQDVKVVPGNHANFDLFVQSTSTNRKLVRGTKVLIAQ